MSIRKVFPAHMEYLQSQEGLGEEACRIARPDPHSLTGMLAYYEGQTEYPPVHLLPALAQALGVSTDELLGVTRLTRAKAPSGRLHRRLTQLEAMPPKAKRQVLQVLDTFLERERLKKQVAGG